eukprot:COSAG01_NODE_1079_length_11822_cov_4.368762_6_plen_83_part_00
MRRRAQLMDGLSYPLSVAWALRHRRLQHLMQGLGTGGGGAVRQVFFILCGPFWLRFTYVTPVLVTKYRGWNRLDSRLPAPRR